MLKEQLSKFLSPYKISNYSLSIFLDSLTIDNEGIFISFNLITKEDSNLIKNFYPQIKNHIIKDLQLINDPNKIFITYSMNTKFTTMHLNTPKNIKNILAINSSKGGVGKSSTALHLAYALKSLNLKIALLDADIYGPSLSQMTGLTESPQISATKKMIPLQKDNIKFNSISFLLQKESAITLKSPIISKTFTQLIAETSWGDIDFLIIDLPPGTGDIHLNLYNNYLVSTTILVSTPQEVALIDLSKTIHMLKKLNQPILGLIENMSYFICYNCNKKHYIFSTIKENSIITQHSPTILAKIPLYEKIQTYLDNGNNIINQEPTHPISLDFINLASKINHQYNS